MAHVERGLLIECYMDGFEDPKDMIASHVNELEGFVFASALQGALITSGFSVDEPIEEDFGYYFSLVHNYRKYEFSVNIGRGRKLRLDFDDPDLELVFDRQKPGLGKVLLGKKSEEIDEEWGRQVLSKHSVEKEPGESATAMLGIHKKKTKFWAELFNKEFLDERDDVVQAVLHFVESSPEINRFEIMQG